MTKMEFDAQRAFQKFEPDLTRYARVVAGASNADDVVSQAFHAVLASGRWELIEDHRAYLFRAVLNATRSMQRSAGRRADRELRAVELPSEGTYLADPEVGAAVGRLSPQQRAVIYLTYWDDLSVAVVATTLGVSDGTVRRQLARARARLRKVL